MITTGGQLAILLNKLIDDLDGTTVTISQNVNFKTFLWCFVPIFLIVKMTSALRLILTSRLRSDSREKGVTPLRIFYYYSHKIEFILNWCNDLYFELLTKTHKKMVANIDSHISSNKLYVHNKKWNFQIISCAPNSITRLYFNVGIQG